MKPILPINQDVEPFDAKNGETFTSQNTVFDKRGSRSNERGFDIAYENLLAEGQRVVGFIEHTDGVVVLFTVYLDGVSEIGRLKRVGGVIEYEVVCKDTVGNILIGFSLQHSVTGIIGKTLNNQYLCLFRSDDITPKILNLDNLPFEVNANKEIINNGELINLFPDINIPIYSSLELSNTGGSLFTGTYYLFLSYEYADGQATDSFNPSLPLYVVSDLDTVDFYNRKGNDTSVLTNKSITVSLENVDEKFSKVRISFIVEKDTGVSSFYWKSIAIAGDTMTFQFSGEENSPVELTSLLANTTIYKRIHTVDQVNRRPYIANLESSPINPSLQHIANEIKSQWVDTEIGVNSTKDSYSDFSTLLDFKTFQPDEVYALYIEYINTDGSSAGIFHIPGREIQIGEDALDPVNTPEEQALGSDVRKYQTRSYADSDNTEGNLSYWENKDEVYPDIAGFNDNPSGSLTGQNVRHHKMPSLRYLIENDYDILEPDTDVGSQSYKLRFVEDAEITDTQDNESVAYCATAWGTTAGTGNGLFHTDEFFPKDSPESSIEGTPNGMLFFDKKAIIRIEYYVLLRGEVYYDADLEYFEASSKLFIQRNGAPIEYLSELSNIESAGPYTARVEDRISTIIEVNPGDALVWWGLLKAYSSGGSINRPKGVLNICLEVHTVSASRDADASSTKNTTGIGLKLTNIVIPPSIQSTLQGYKIHIAKRSFQNSTVLDSSVQYISNSFTYTDGDDSEKKVYRRNYTDYTEQNPRSTSGDYTFDNYFSNPDPSEDYRDDEGTLFTPVDIIHSNLDAQPPIKGYVPLSLLKTRSAIIPTYLDIQAVYKVDRGIYQKPSQYDVDIPSKIHPIQNYEYVEDNYLTVSQGTEGSTAHVEIELLNGDIVIVDTEVDFWGIPHYSTTPFVYLKVIKDNIYSIYSEQETFLATTLIPVNEDDTLLVGDSFSCLGELPLSQTSFTDLASQYNVPSLNFGNPEYAELVDIFYNTIVDRNSLFPLIQSPINMLYREEVTEDSDSVRPVLSTTYSNSYSAVNDFITSIIFSESSTRQSYKHPYRVHRGIAIGKEEPELKWRTFQALDYYEMPTDKGVVWNLQRLDDKLIIHMADGLFLTRGEESLQTDATTVAIGTADIFEREPQEILPSKDGHAGTFSQIGAIMTKYGYVFIDEKRGKIYIAKKGDKGGLSLQNITKGLDDFFRSSLSIQDNLNIDLTSFENTDVKDNPFNTQGFSAVFDDYYDRLIVSKISNQGNWTLSFNIEQGGWISFHTYSPNVLFNIVYENYSISRNYRHLYKHSSNLLRGTYYDQLVSNDSFVDIIFNQDSPIDKIFSSIYWNADVLEQNGAYNNRKTISRIFIYNAYQASAEIDIQRLRNARKTGGLWACNDFRDILTDEARDALAPFLQNGFIDPSMIDQNKAWYRKTRFQSNYIIVRFLFDNINNEDIFIHNVEVETRKEIR